MAISPELLRQAKNPTELPKSTLKWDGQTPYIVYKRQVHKAKEVIIEGQPHYVVRASGATWLVRMI